MVRRVVILAMLSVALPAHAEDVAAYQAEGSAPANGTDPRTAAIDDAFARAVASAIADVVPGDARTARKADLDREFIGHARIWVVKYSVTKDETADGRRELTVSARIDRDKVRAKLAELGIPTKDTGPVTPAQPQQRTVTILLRIAAPSGVRADYGASAEKDLPGVSALTSLLRNAELAVRRAPASGPAARAEGDLPLEDDEAESLADAAKADLALIAGVSLAPPAQVHGVAQPVQLVTARVRLIDRIDHKAIGQGSAYAAARGEDPGVVGYAIDRALLAAAADVVPPAPKKLAQAGAYKGDDVPVAESGVVLIRLPSRTSFSMVQTELKYLAGAKGVRAATLRRLSPNGWVIGVSTNESIERIAQIAKKPPATDTDTNVKIVGNLIELSLSGSP